MLLPPFQQSWNTIIYPNATHTIYATAWDYANNAANSTIVFAIVNNTYVNATNDTGGYTLLAGRGRK